MTTNNLQAKINAIAESQIAEYTRTIADPPFFSNSDDVVRFANRVAKMEGELTVFSRIPTVAEYPRTDTEILQFVFTMLTNGADDEWSGRGNDARRSHFDGVRKAADYINDAIRFGE